MSAPVPNRPTHEQGRTDEPDDDLFAHLLEELRIAVAGLRSPSAPLTPDSEAALRARLDPAPPLVPDVERE